MISPAENNKPPQTDRWYSALQPAVWTNGCRFPRRLVVDKGTGMTSDMEAERKQGAMTTGFVDVTGHSLGAAATTRRGTCNTQKLRIVRKKLSLIGLTDTGDFGTLDALRFNRNSESETDVLWTSPWPVPWAVGRAIDPSEKVKTRKHFGEYCAVLRPEPLSRAVTTGPRHGTCHGSGLRL